MQQSVRGLRRLLQMACLTALGLTVFWQTSLPAQETDRARYSRAIARLHDAIRYEVQSKDLPAFSISLVAGEQVIWFDGFGHQNVERQERATPLTVYRVGSVSKLFTDIAIMQLVEQGRLDLDAPVSEYLPTFAPTNPYDEPITLRRLMSHRSGLVREPPVGHYFDPTEPTLAETVRSLNGTTLVYEPGTKTKYSNAAIATVGAVLEAASDTPFSQYIDEQILQPLGMTRSSFVLTPEVEENLATAWMWTYDGRRFEAPTFAMGMAPAGNLYSTVIDLSNFLLAIFAEGRGPGGAIVKPETLAKMIAPGTEADGSPQRFGLGFHVTELDGHRQIGHGGAVYGFSTQLEALPDRMLGVAAVAALDGSNGVVGRLTEYALRLMLAAEDGEELPEYRKTDAVPAARARAMAGTYAHGDELAEVVELNGRLYLHRGALRHELRADRDDGTLLVDDPLAFGTSVRLTDAGALMIGETEYVYAPDEPPAEIDARWRGLLGEYGWDHNTLYILEDRGRLIALIEWFFYYPLTELGEDRFAFPDYGLYHGEELQFARDASGRATRVVAAGIVFDRREVGTEAGETFQITPVRPIDELRSEALAAEPPAERGQFRPTDLVELAALDPSIQLDIRYATTNNFTGAVFYKQPRAFMQRPAAEALVHPHRQLKLDGLGLLIHDAYRPWHVTKMFWDATPAEMKDFVANPAAGSRHNRGCAVDLTLYDLATGEPIQMVAGYDEFSPRSFPTYPGGTSRQRYYRDLLRRTMETAGFTVYEYEWWHFDYRDWRKYAIGNATFEEILAAAPADSQTHSENNDLLQFEVERSVVHSGWDGQRCWVHARTGAIPSASGAALPDVVLTTQQLQVTGSDVFYALHSTRSDDLGHTWAPLARQTPFERRTNDDRAEITVCDFCPKWHAATRTLLGTGQTVWYRDNRVMSVRPRATAYSVYEPKSHSWLPWQPLQMPDELQFENCGAGSVQRYDLPTGDILLPVYFKEPEAKQYSVTVCRCSFDGQKLTYREHGSALTVDVKRGLYEPSLTRFGERFYLTLRNDDHGYVATSDDGLHYDEPQVWRFDDGEELGNYNTQQHWVTHSDGLFLVYTRKGADNDHIFRHRAPLFIGQVDPETLRVIRATEQIVVPQRGARLGNFGITDVSPSETWITVTEWMQKWGPDHILPVDNEHGADNSIYVAKLKWNRPNRLMTEGEPETK